MDSLETEFIDFACKKLGGIAHANVEYFYDKQNRRSLAGFECKQAEDCDIGRSPFSNTFNYTVQCPLYIALENNMNDVVTMKVIVDARGISRAERVSLIERAIQKAEEGEIVVLADDENEKEDISQAVRNHGWIFKGIESHGESYRITISKP